MLIKIFILAITAVAKIAAAITEPLLMPLRDCESVSEIDFDTHCDDLVYVPSLPLCGKGQRLSRTCVTQSQVSEACTSCEPNFFQPYKNHCSTCHPCTMCRADQRVKQACNVENDTVCENLDPGSTDSPQAAIPSSQKVTVPPSSPPATGYDYQETATPGTTPPGTTSGKAGISNKPTTAISQNDTVTPMAGDDEKKGATSVQDGYGVTITLAVFVGIFALLFMITLACCIRYKRQADVLGRRDPNGNEQNGDIELRGQADRRHYTRVPTSVSQDEREQNDRSSPSLSPDTCRSAAGGSCPNGLDAGSSCGDPVYAAVNKSRKSKVMAEDAQRERSLPVKSSDPTQRPSTSANSPHRHAVCRTIRKVFKGRSEGTAKKKRELCSSSGQGHFSEQPHGSSKSSTKQESAMPTVGPVPSDGHTESGGSKASLHSTAPPSSLPTSSPSLSHPIPSHLPLERPLQQSTVTSLRPLQSSPPPPTSSLPTSSSPPPQTSSQPPSSPPSSTPLPPTWPTPSSTLPSSPTPPSSPAPPPSLPPVFSKSPPSSSRKKMHLNSSQLPTGATVKKSDVKENVDEEDTRDDAPKSERNSKANPPKESSSCSPVSPGSRVTEDPPRGAERGAQRGAEGGASSLSPSSPGEKPKVKSLPEPRDDVGEKAEEELKNSSISPDEVVSERFLDFVTDVISLDVVERISRELGLQQTVINNIKQSLLYTGPKNIGFHILREVLSLQGCKLTFQRVLIALRDCGQKNAGDTLIAEFKINMNLKRR